MRHSCVHIGATFTIQCLFRVRHTKENVNNHNTELFKLQQDEITNDTVASNLYPIIYAVLTFQHEPTRSNSPLRSWFDNPQAHLLVRAMLHCKGKQWWCQTISDQTRKRTVVHFQWRPVHAQHFDNGCDTGTSLWAVSEWKHMQAPAVSSENAFAGCCNVCLRKMRPVWQCTASCQAVVCRVQQIMREIR